MKHRSILLLTVTVLGISRVESRAESAQPRADTVTGRSITAIGYQVDVATTVNLRNTGLIGRAYGRARVEASSALTRVESNIQGLTPATQLGAEFLTYVLWAVSPEGRAINLGEVTFEENGKGRLRSTTQLQTFSLFVTAEPYSAVRQPSEMVVLENDIRNNTKGKVFVVNDYKLMRRSQYQKLGNPLALSMDLRNVPIQVYEARNSVEIAKSRGADRYAPEIFSKAEASLKITENAVARKGSRKELISLSRQTAQFSEDSRSLAVERKEQERIEAERAASAASAKAQAEAKAAAQAAEAKRSSDAEAQRQAELAAAREQQLKAESAAKEAQMKAEADVAAAKAEAEAYALRMKEEAANADAERARQAAEGLRAQLLEQFNRILETRDTPRGLLITMADVLFDTGKYDLRPAAREKLAKLSGIILAHAGLALQVEGHTDSTGSDSLNQRLSEQRAGVVRDYLVGQALSSDAVTAKGFGKNMPVDTNSTAAGRQRNRRVELIVSGEVIGVEIGK